MKSIMFVLIGYITCTLKGEMNETGTEEKTDNVEPPNGKDPQVDVEQQMDAVQSVGEQTTDAVEPSYNEDQSVNVEHSEDGMVTDAVDTTASEDTVNTRNPTAEATTVDTSYAVEQPDDTSHAEITDAVDTTDGIDTNTTHTVVEQPLNLEQPEDAATTNAVDKRDPVDTIGEKDVQETEPTKKQEIQAADTGPSNIKVEAALKILEKSKKKYALESIALIRRLEWLRSTFNITELKIDHKIDPNEDFDDLSNTENSLNSSNILRKGIQDGFVHIKEAIMKISTFTVTISSIIKKKRKMDKIKEEAKRYKTNFIATHSDRENLKKIYLSDSNNSKKDSED